MGGINWGQSAVSFGGALLNMMEQGRRQRQEEEQLRQIQAEQARMAAQLRASGTVPANFGSLLESIQPPAPATPAGTGILGTFGDMFRDIGRSGEGLSKLDLLPTEMRQQTLETMYREMAAQEAERGREKRQGARETALEARRAADRAASEARQQAGFTHSEQMAAAERAAAEARQAQRDREAQALQTRREQTQRELETQRETGRATAKTKAEARKEMDRMIDEYGPSMNQAQMNRFNRLVAENPDAAREAGYTGFRWQPGTIWGGSVVPIEQQAPAGTSPGGPPQGAAAMAAHAASTQTLTPDQEARARELKKRLGIP